MSERFRLSSESEFDDDGTFGLYFPKFVWAVRDFTLQLEIDGKAVTSDQYLEHALTCKKGIDKATTLYNLPRKCIRRYFPSRKCFTFPLPVSDSESMGQLETITSDKFAAEFIQKTNEFCDYILQQSEPKSIKGVIMDGQKLAHIFAQYIEDIQHDRIPCITSAVEATAKAVNESVLADCVSYYKSHMSVVQPSDDENSVESRHEQSSAHVKDMFAKRIMILDDPNKFGKLLSDAISEEYQKICDNNANLSHRKCRKILEDLMEELNSHIADASYYCVGGYAKYQFAFKEACRKYKEIPNKGVHAAEVLKEFKREFSSKAQDIMLTDKALGTAVDKEENTVIDELVQLELSEQERLQKLNQQDLDDKNRLQLECEMLMQERYIEQAKHNEHQIKELSEHLLRETERLRSEGAKEDVAFLEMTISDLQKSAQTSDALHA